MIGLLRGALAAAILATSVSAPAVQAADLNQAQRAAEALASGAHAAMTGETSEADRLAALKEEVSQAFAFDIWERFLLGDRAATFSDAQTDAFRALLPDYLSRLYFNQFGQGLDQAPDVLSAKAVRKDVLVRAEIPRATGDRLPVDWRMREFEGRGPLVIDVMVGGASFLLLKRDEFGAVLDRGGPSALIAFMQEFAAGQ